MTQLQYKSLGNQLYWIIIGVLTLSLLSCGNDDLDENENPGFFTTIYQDEPIEGTLTFNLDSLNYYKAGDNEVNGTLRLDLGEQLTVPVELRARGVFRKKLCPFPPIRLQLKKTAVLNNNWGPYRNYKLVTHCFDTTSTDELLMREYLTYKLYSELSDISFKAQLIQMQYFVNGDTLQHFAILIENESEMSARLDLDEMDIEKTKLKRVHFDHYKRFVLFQYMVGNTDWNLNAGHNTKFVLEDDSDTPIIIPYDFDCSGLVNAPYAIPYPDMPITDVRERHFMYRGNKNDDFTKTILELKEKKASLYALVNDFPHLSEYAKEDVLNYIGEFYEIIEQSDWKDLVFLSGE